MLKGPPGQPMSPETMRYIRMYLGGESGEPGLTLYEIDDEGWVHRQFQLHADGSRFSPEDILMRRPVNPTYMAAHPAAEEIGRDEFEQMWDEVAATRAFADRLPDPDVPWEGWLQGPEALLRLLWAPKEGRDAGFARVPGFAELFVEGDARTAWLVQRLVFLDRPIHWTQAARGEVALREVA